MCVLNVCKPVDFDVYLLFKENQFLFPIFFLNFKVACTTLPAYFEVNCMSALTLCFINQKDRSQNKGWDFLITLLRLMEHQFHTIQIQ